MANGFGVLDLAELTDVGLKRQKNEDASKMVVPPPHIGEAGTGAFFMVADGMGGLGGGDVASKAAIDEIVRTLYSAQVTESDPIQRLQVSLESANVFVREQASSAGLPRIGSTAAGILLRLSGDIVIFNVGDCRVYRIRKGRIERVSRDQSVTERQIESGMITEEAARQSRNSMVTAFLGQPVPIKPVLAVDRAQPGDVYLVCSDGLWGLADPKELLDIVKRAPARVAVQNLIQLALSRGGNDNITAIVVRLGKPPFNVRRLFPLLIAFLVVLGVVGALVLSGRNNDATTQQPTVTSAPALGATAEATQETIKVIPTATPETIVVSTIAPSATAEVTPGP